jgi:tryptophan synthase alpha chain
MNRIDQLFKNKNGEKVLSIYFSAGFPNLNDTETIILELEKNGVDLIEIGIPFSDPLADGPIIQASGQRALENGMTLSLLFDQLKNIRSKTQIPLILMGYLNSVLQYGEENFCTKCKEVGIDGVILPDLPMDYYQVYFKDLFDRFGINNILLISPQTSEERIREIDDTSSGFIYLVSSNSITGANKGLEAQKEYFQRIDTMKLKNPKVVGFGIHDQNTFNQATAYTEGAIIGSAFIKALQKNHGLKTNIHHFVKSLRNAKNVPLEANFDKVN